MKKVFAGLTLSILLVPSFAFAQVTPAPTLEEQIQALVAQVTQLQQLLTLLQKVEALQARLDSQSEDIRVIRENTTSRDTGTADDEVEEEEEIEFSVHKVHRTDSDGIRISTNKEIDSSSVEVRIQEAGKNGNANTVIDTSAEISEVSTASGVPDGFKTYLISFSPDLDSFDWSYSNSGYLNIESVDGDSKKLLPLRYE